MFEVKIESVVELLYGSNMCFFYFIDYSVLIVLSV